MLQIPDHLVQAALDLLRANTHAFARAAHEKSERYLKIVLAKAELEADGKTVGERTAKALTSDAYIKAVDEHELVSQAYFHERDRRDAAIAVIDAWRTQQSDNRSMGRLA